MAGGVRRKWTDEDAAFAAVQWASGVSQKDIAAIFGYANTAMQAAAATAEDAWMEVAKRRDQDGADG